MRSILITYLLWIPPLGLLGVHRFYCGRVGSGLLYLLTGGLLGIGWLVDLFLIPGIVRETNLSARLNRHEFLLGGARAPVSVPVFAADRSPRVIYCVRCGSAMQVPAGAGGEAYRCPMCSQALIVPAIAS